MINFDRDNFDSLTTKEKEAFVNDLVVKNLQLTEKEIQYLVPQNREKYFYNRVRTSDWLSDYEFHAMSDKEKEIYIWNNRYLQTPDLARLPEHLQDEYISKAITSGVQLKPEEFNMLANDDFRRKYVKQKIMYGIDITFTSEELDYLEADDQIQYLNTLNRMGLAPNPEEFSSFKPKAIRYYKSQVTLQEVRKVVREEISKILLT